MEELTKQVADYLRADDNDLTLDALVKSAVQYIEQSTGIPFDGVDNLYITAIKMLAAHWYDNRGVLTTTANDIPFSVEALINHIKLCGDYRN